MEAMDFNTAALQQLMVHYVGNKANAEALHLSEQAPEPDDKTAERLADGLLHRFKKTAELFAFHHATSLQYNAVFNLCKTIFEDADAFESSSVDLAKQLYEASTHPKVKGGELYVALFDALPLESRLYKAIGLFKTETKSLFLDTETKSKTIALAMREGTELTRVDKGCLVINRNEDTGFDVLLFDNQSRGEEALYWRETFLGLQPQKNSFHHTNHVLSLTKQFITGQSGDEPLFDKKEQVELLHKSIAYFNEKDAFDIDEFQTEVFADADKIDSFRQFGSRYVENHDYDIASSFDISANAVKKQSRIYKSVLKLDKNFHIYIHGRTDLIERGTDDDGRKYYKLYYQDEE